MANQLDKLNNFTRNILNDAKTECDAIFAEIEKERKQSLSAAEDEVLSETYQFIKSEVSRLKTQSGRAVSKKVLDNKRVLCARREEIAERVISGVKARLAEFVKTDEYIRHLIGLLQHAEKQFDCGDTTVFLAAADMHLVPALKQALTRTNVSFCETDSIKLGGLIAECPSKQLRADETFDSDLIELQGHFSELLGLGIANYPS